MSSSGDKLTTALSSTIIGSMFLRRIAAVSFLSLSMILAVAVSIRWNSMNTANGAEWVLVVFTGLTLLAIAWQAYETRRSVQTSTRSVALQKASMDQWVVTDEWEGHVPHTFANAKKATLTVEFLLRNNTERPLILRSLVLWFDYFHAKTVSYPEMTLMPEESMPVSFDVTLEGQKLALYLAGHLSFLIGGVISYVDVFKDTKFQKFCVIGNIGPAKMTTFVVGSFVVPKDAPKALTGNA